jgi:TatD DNase family protein
VLTDTHCHLDFNRFDKDRAQVIARALEAGVTRVLNPGIDLESCRAAIKLAEENEQVYAAVGVHPNSALTWNDSTLAELEELARHRKVVAVGEIGLDYYRDRAPRDLQKQVFLSQLELAASLQLPVVIHNRQSTSELLEILVEWQAKLVAEGSSLAERPGVLHSYSDEIAPAMEAIEHNFFIGFTGPVTFNNARELQLVATTLPIECMLIETDAPFLTPHPFRGKRNEPARVRLVAEKIAELKKQPYNSIACVTTENAARLFNW